MIQPITHPVTLKDAQTDQPVAAELVFGVTDKIIDLWTDTWKPQMDRGQLVEQGLAREEWPEDKCWEWAEKLRSKRYLLVYPSMCVICNGRLEGLMSLDLSKRSRIVSQDHIIYVSLIATAPWNRKKLSSLPGLKGIGSVLIAAAVQLSIQEGCKGRIGLHSLPKAEAFYRRFQMKEFGADPKCHNLNYFELTDEGAKIFLP